MIIYIWLYIWIYLHWYVNIKYDHKYYKYYRIYVYIIIYIIIIYIYVLLYLFISSFKYIYISSSIYIYIHIHICVCACVYTTSTISILGHPPLYLTPIIPIEVPRRIASFWAVFTEPLEPQKAVHNIYTLQIIGHTSISMKSWCENTLLSTHANITCKMAKKLTVVLKKTSPGIWPNYNISPT